MPLRIDTDTSPPRLILEGVVSIEETDGLLEAFSQYPDIGVDLSACEHLHTAPLQLLKLRRVTILAPPADSFWLRCLDSVPATPGEPATPEPVQPDSSQLPEEDWGLFP